MSLVGEWDFEGGYGTVAFDSSGLGNNGVLTGILPPVWSSDARVGSYSLLFNFIYKSCVVLPALPLALAESRSLWIKTSTCNAAMGLVVYFSSTLPISSQLRINQGQLQFYAFSGTNGLTVFTNISLCDSQWHLVGLTSSPTMVGLYIDGNLAQSLIPSTSQISMLASIAGRVDGLEMGCQEGKYLFNGQLDDVRLYQRELSSNEIANICTFLLACFI